MTLFEFNELDNLNEKLDSVFEDGQYITSRWEGQYRFSLYQFDTFYVETCSGNQEENEPLIFIAFTSLERLDPYLDAIDISMLLK